jgi:hypothetical protein
MRRAWVCVLFVVIMTAVWPCEALAQAPLESPGNGKNAAVATKKTAAKPAAIERFELKDGDRVVFLGNTFFEREGRYGYIETMLTTRYPGKRITFRNLGWSGDTVWGESRGYFEPEKGYQNLMDLVAELKPTVILLAYGNNEAFAGKEGLKPFVKQYNKLLDDLEQFTKRIVIFEPLSHEPLPPPMPGVEAINKEIALYNEAIAELAEHRGFACVCGWTHIFQTSAVGRFANPDAWHPQTQNGINATPAGYWHIARWMGLGSKPEDERGTTVDGWQAYLTIDAKKPPTSSFAKIENLKTSKDRIYFTLTDPFLPTCEYPVVLTGDLTPPGDVRFATFAGLEPGRYTLSIDGKTAATADHTVWANAGVVKSPEILQVVELRHAIIAKNQLFFHRWRPQNTTYLLGFRKHEQGQNAKEIAQFDPLIAAKEEEIFKLAQPVPHKYELIRVKEQDGGGKRRDGDQAGVEKGGK